MPISTTPAATMRAEVSLTGFGKRFHSVRSTSSG
jgi:hypothetical protein